VENPQSLLTLQCIKC